MVVFYSLNANDQHQTVFGIESVEGAAVAEWRRDQSTVDTVQSFAKAISYGLKESHLKSPLSYFRILPTLKGLLLPVQQGKNDSNFSHKINHAKVKVGRQASQFTSRLIFA